MASILYITEQGALVCKTGERIVVRKGEQVFQDIPAFKVEQIVLMGNTHITTPAVNFCLTAGIDVVYLSRGGKYRGRLLPVSSGNVALRRLQFERAANPAFCLEVARRIVAGKISSMTAFCRRQRGYGEQMGDQLKAMKKIYTKVSQASKIDSLYGLEGSASALYFRLLRQFIPEQWAFVNRNAHPPKDPVNAMLSLGYTLLYNNFVSLIAGAGLDPYLGFFHQTRLGHACLASDLMEEFRPVIVDSVVLRAINQNIISQQDFHVTEKGPLFAKEGLGKFVSLYEKRVNRSFTHPVLGVIVTYRGCFELQVRHLVRVLLDREDAYSPLALQSEEVA